MEGPRPAAIPGAGGRNTLHPLICAAMVAAAAVLAYLNSFQGAFQLDDYKVLLSDPAVRSLGGWWSDLGRGIRPLIRKKCDFLISVPMRGQIASLNVSVAAGVILYEILRKWGKGA